MLARGATRVAMAMGAMMKAKKIHAGNRVKSAARSWRMTLALTCAAMLYQRNTQNKLAAIPSVGEINENGPETSSRRR